MNKTHYYELSRPTHTVCGKPVLCIDVTITIRMVTCKSCLNSLEEDLRVAKARRRMKDAR